MYQAKITAWIQRFVESIGRHLARCVVKIDKKIATKNHVEVAIAERIGRLCEIDASELNCLPQIVAELILVAHALEILLQPRLGKILYRASGVASRASAAQNARINVGRDNLHVPLFDA